MENVSAALGTYTGEGTSQQAPEIQILEEKYVLLERLGSGQYGEVWQAMEDITKGGRADKIVAVKIFKKICRSETIKNELGIMKQLHDLNASSRNLVDVVETNMLNNNGRNCLVLEYLAGKELFDRIVDKGQYSEKEAARTIAALADALCLLHSKKIIHRDLKPENVVYRSMDDSADPVIVDFGFAKIADQSMPDGSCYHEDPNAFTPLGTHGYISPESYERCLYSSKSDVWALGVMTYTILVGFPPFDSKDKQLSLRTRRGKYYPLSTAPWDNISEEAKDLVRRMLCVDVHERLRSEDVLEHPWILMHTKSSDNKRGGDGGAADGGIVGADGTEGANEEITGSGKNLGTEYVERLQRLQSKSKFKKAVNGIVWSIRLRKAAVRQAIAKGIAENQNTATEMSGVELNTVADEKVSSVAMNMGEDQQRDSSSAAAEATAAVPMSVEGHGRTSSDMSIASVATDSQLGSDSPNSQQHGGARAEAEARADGNTNLVISLDQIQRLATGLSRNSSHKNPLSRNSSTSAGFVWNESPGTGSMTRKQMRRGSASSITSPLIDGNMQWKENADEKKNSNSSQPSEGEAGADEDMDQKMVGDEVMEQLRQPVMKRLSSSVLDTFREGGGVNYEEFCRAVTSVGMTILATRHVFDAFDQSGTGVVSITEFISTMVGFRGDIMGAAPLRRDESKPQEGTVEHAEDVKSMKCRFFFNIFDLDGSGFISRDELFHVVGVLLSDVRDEDNVFVKKHRKSLLDIDKGNTPISSPLKQSTKHRDSVTEELLDFPDQHPNNLNIGHSGVEIDFHALFDSIDTDGSGEICYDEFQTWFEHGDSMGLFHGLLDDIDAVQARFKEHFGDSDVRV